MKQEKECHFCKIKFESDTIWYLPQIEEYMSICEECVLNEIKELPPDIIIRR